MLSDYYFILFIHFLVKYFLPSHIFTTNNLENILVAFAPKPNLPVNLSFDLL